jgi:hypothetical protein
MSNEKKEEPKETKPKGDFQQFLAERRDFPVISGATPPEIPQPKPKGKEEKKE